MKIMKTRKKEFQKNIKKVDISKSFETFIISTNKNTNSKQNESNIENKYNKMFYINQINIIEENKTSEENNCNIRLKLFNCLDEINSTLKIIPINNNIIKHLFDEYTYLLNLLISNTNENDYIRNGIKNPTEILDFIILEICNNLKHKIENSLLIISDEIDTIKIALSGYDNIYIINNDINFKNIISKYKGTLKGTIKSILGFKIKNIK